MDRLQERVEEIKTAYPIEEGKVSFILVNSYCETLGEHTQEIIPFVLAGYTYVAWAGTHGFVIANEDVGITYNDVERFMGRPPASYVTTEDGIEGIIYQAMIG
jgi:predicted transcriptional regulator